MPRLTVVLGVVLIVLGLGAYLLTGRVSVTAMVPAFFGVPLVGLGRLAAGEAFRRAALVLATLVAAAGVAGTARGLAALPRLLSGGDVERPEAVAVQAAMGLLCLTYVLLAALRLRARD